jgi:hypothetical protein
MAAFIAIPDFGLAPEGEFVLRSEMIYSSDLWPHLIHVPAGFVTDFASIPRIFRWLHPVNARHRKAAVIHDYLCRKPGFIRKVADKIFLEAMKLSGVARWRRTQMYLAVRLLSLFLRLKTE